MIDPMNAADMFTKPHLSSGHAVARDHSEQRRDREQRDDA
jgi:hypothetical protein